MNIHYPKNSREWMRARRRRTASPMLAKLPRPGVFRPKPRCSFCKRPLPGPYFSVEGKSRCYWCHKRITGG